MVLSLVALVQVPVNLVQVIVDLVQTHSPQGGLQSVVSRQVGPIFGLVESFWSVFVRGAGMEQVVRGLGLGLVESGGGAGHIDTHVAPGAQ